jgi:hypothetical protein
MPSVSFSQIVIGKTYSRNDLAQIWKYSSFHAIARGVVTPKDDDKIIIFVTEEKQPGAEQYTDKLTGNILEWEGPTDHFAESRMINAGRTGEKIHLFYRTRHHTDFIYAGTMKVLDKTINTKEPSKFKFQVE